jgi:pimeloyl-ACP methyl ester carboxylesterase
MSVAFIEHLIGPNSLAVAAQKENGYAAHVVQPGHSNLAVLDEMLPPVEAGLINDRDDQRHRHLLSGPKITINHDDRRQGSRHTEPMSNSQTFILVHGSWQGAWSWNGVRDRLRSYGHRVITPNLPGRGDVGEDRSWIGHDDNVAAVLAALDADDNGAVVLAGHSLGGAVVSQVADRRPERIARLVYCAAFVLEDGESAGDVMPQEMRRAIQELSASRADRAIPMPWELWRASFMQTGPEELARASFAQLVPDPYRPVFEPIRLHRAVHRELPASFLAFNHDRTMPPGFWHPEMSGRLGDANVVAIDGDHELPLTGPEQLGDALRFVGASTR